MEQSRDFAQLEITGIDQLHGWLVQSHATETGLWLVTFKSRIAYRHVPQSAILDELLCFGWINGARRKLDSERSKQFLSPRTHQIWAKAHKARAARLIAQGRMHCSGFAAIETSILQGLWKASIDSEALSVPDDLASALASRPGATKAFASFSDVYRRNVLQWLRIAKTPLTRSQRVISIARHAAKRQKMLEW